MSEEINEPILVTAKFEKGRLTPLLFFWRGRGYRVDGVSFAWAAKRGEAKLYYFNCRATRAQYQLIFNDRTLDWRLGRVEAEG